MAKMRWTPGQQHCIDARGGTVLVSAAAGSGKTAVLIERIVSLLCDNEHPIDIDRLLVVTFTKAAAAEMRSRLNGRLAEKLADDPHNRHLLRQQMLLPQATICTIDSFCAQLLREQAQQAGVSPRFRVAEDTTLRLLKNDVATRVIEETYKNGAPSFLALCNTLAGDRGDGHLSEQLLRTYDFIQAHPFPLQWLDRQQARFDAPAAARDTVWGEILLEQIGEELETAKEALTRAIDDIVTDERMQTAYGGSISIALSGVVNALAAMDDDWDAVKRAVESIRFERVKALRGYEDAAFKEYIAALRDHAKKAVETAKELLDNSEDDIRRDIAAAAPLIGALFDLVRHFTAEFAAAKAEQNILDFNDMEHLALSLLAIPNADGSFTRTEAAKEIGARFAHIMVDEYQDTNATQDTLFSALSDDERNLFFVGDIKQSIYGFRQAMPAIFRSRRENSTPFNGTDFPASITLGNNFRSRAQVTDSVNFFFRRLMGEKTGGIVYDEREELVSSAAFEAADSHAYDTELLILQKKEFEEPLSAHQAEARLIGQRILKMLSEGFSVSDKQGLRPASYRDFCILLRSTSRTAPIFVKELQAMGLPVSTGSHESFFDCVEIRLALSILRAIDNPLLDIPMLSALMSPIYGFSADDLTVIRGVGKDLPLFTAMRRLSRAEHPLSERCRSFLDTLDKYRTLSAALPADRVIRRLFEDTDMLSIMSAKTGGTQRIANLRKLYDLARHYEEQDFRGLAAFVRYMDRLEEQGVAIPTASKDGDGQNAIKLMTIHRSKGLEFPVVFVAALGSDFNAASVRDDVLVHADYGVGLTLRDRENFTESRPIHHKALAAAITRSERTEELRVLYVALTRAKDKLVLLTTVDRLRPTLERLRIAAGQGTDALSPSFVLRASRMSDWVLAAAMQHPAGAVLHDVLAELPTQHSTADGVTIEITAPQATEDMAATLAEEYSVTLPSGTRERLDFVYPYAALGQIPAKITASQTAHRDAVFTDGLPTLPRPAFLSKGGLTPAERGTATHLFLEHLELATGRSAAEQAECMVKNGILSEAQKQALALPRLDRFLQSPLAKRMANAAVLLREFPFAIERPIADFEFDTASLPADAAAECLMVQGIADAIFEEDGALVIVDYKTDRVEHKDELAQRYRSQLLIYKEALERALQRPVKSTLIYSFHCNDTVEIL